MPRGEFRRIEELWPDNKPADDQSVTEEILPASIPKPKQEFFTKIKAARELLQQGALERLQQMEAIIAQAAANGQYEVALENIKWLIDHTPADEEGNRMIEGSVDKKSEGGNQTAPSIQIGFQLGGVTVAQKALPSTSIIDVTPEDHE